MDTCIDIYINEYIYIVRLIFRYSYRHRYGDINVYVYFDIKIANGLYALCLYRNKIFLIVLHDGISVYINIDVYIDICIYDYIYIYIYISNYIDIDSGLLFNSTVIFYSNNGVDWISVFILLYTLELTFALISICVCILVHILIY